jgi:hypothetical protein
MKAAFKTSFRQMLVLLPLNPMKTMISLTTRLLRGAFPGALAAVSVLAATAFCAAAEDGARWVNPLCQPLAVERNGPFVELADGSLMTIVSQGMRVSKDDGKM